MRKLNLLLIVLFVAMFSDAAFAKMKYVAAQAADFQEDTSPVHSESGLERDGITVEENKEEGIVDFYLKKKKLKKLTVYGDPKGGSILVFLVKVDLKTGLLYDLNGDLISEENSFNESFSSGSTSLQVNLPKGLKKKKNEVWVLRMDLIKGDENLPELYGFKYK